MVPTVSVLMSVYNDCSYVEEAILSILNQSYTDFEFIIIDDGSTDGSQKILEKYARVDSRIKLVRQKNSGLTAALNYGLSICHGQLIARQDADDVSLQTRLEKQVHFLEENSKVGLVGTDCQLIDEYGNILNKKEFPFVSENAALQRTLLLFNPFVHTSVMFRSSVMKSIGGYKRAFNSAEDYEAWLSIAESSELSNISEVLVLRRLSSNMISKKRALEQRVSVIKAKMHHLSFNKVSLIVLYFLLKDIARIGIMLLTKKKSTEQLPKVDVLQAPCSVLHISLSASTGGGPEHIYSILKQSQQLESQMYVACPKQLPYWYKFKDVCGGSNLLELPVQRFSFSFLYRLVMFIRTRRPEVIHSHGKGAGVYGRLASFLTRVPCIHTFHGIHVAGMPIIKKRCYLLIERILSYLTASCVAVSKSEARIALEYHLVQERQLEIIPNGVQLTAKCDFSGNEQPPFLIAHMTRFDPVKNTDFLIAVAKILRDRNELEKFSFLILGDGKERSKFEAKVSEEQLDEFFKLPGAVDNPRDYLSSADCYINTSIREGLSLALLEAMAEGVPVLASKVPGNIDAVCHGETGYLFSLDSPECAANLLIDLISDANRWKRFSIASRSLIETDYSIDKMFQRLCRLYKQILDDKRI